MSQKVKFTEVVNKVPWKGNDFPYSQPEFSLWKKATSALSTDTHTHTHTHTHTFLTHTHTFLAGPMGFQTFRHRLLLTLVCKELAGGLLVPAKPLGTPA
jgi:hypothetical protein